MTPKLPGRPGANRRCVLFDWGDTLMRVFPDEVGPMWRWHRVEAVDGVAAALERIRPHAMIGLATNAADSAEGDIWKALRRVDLERRFDRCYCFATVGYRKPHPGFLSRYYRGHRCRGRRHVFRGR